MRRLGLVDESKERDFFMAMCADAPAALASLGSTLRVVGISEHITSESKPRRKRILSIIATSGITAVVYDAGRRRSERDARSVCLGAIVEDAVRLEVGRVVIDRDETMVGSDKQALIEATRLHRCDGKLRYEHQTGRSEPLLALPDAVAWAWAKGGDWRRRVEPIVELRKL